MCTILEFRIVGPRISDGEMLSAVRSFGFLPEGDRVWHQDDREAAFCVDGYFASKGRTCLCPLSIDREGQTRLRGLLEFLLPRCSELYYASDTISLDEELVQEITPTAVHTTHQPGKIAPWGRVKMPEHFSCGLIHLARMMRDAGVEAVLEYSGRLRFRMPELGIEVSGREEEEMAREILATLTRLWAEYGMAAEGTLSADALEARRKVLTLVGAGII